MCVSRDLLYSEDGLTWGRKTEVDTQHMLMLISLLRKLTLIERIARGLSKPYVWHRGNIYQGGLEATTFLVHPKSRTWATLLIARPYILITRWSARWQQRTRGDGKRWSNKLIWPETSQQLQNHLVFSLLTRLHTSCLSTADNSWQQSPNVLNYLQLVKTTPHWYFPSLKKSTRKELRQWRTIIQPT